MNMQVIELSLNMDIHSNIYFTVAHEMAVDKIFAREFTLVPFHPNAVDVNRGGIH